MFDKAKPTKPELRKLVQGIEAADALAQQLAALDQAIEAGIKTIAFVDRAARMSLSRTQLSLGVGSSYLQRLAAAGRAYLMSQQQKPAPKGKPAAKAKVKAKAKPKSKAKPALKAKGVATTKAKTKVKG
jgi:hypothetical protein